MGDKVTLIDSAEETALEVKRNLEEKEMINISHSEPQYKFYVSDFPEKFVQISERFLGKKVKEVKKIDINKY